MEGRSSLRVMRWPRRRPVDYATTSTPDRGTSPVPETSPLLLINAVGLTGRLLPPAPRLNPLAKGGWGRPLREVVPAVTCTAQASLLTGRAPDGHGVVGNGWLFRETGEVRFW